MAEQTANASTEKEEVSNIYKQSYGSRALQTAQDASIVGLKYAIPVAMVSGAWYGAKALASWMSND